MVTTISNNDFSCDKGCKLGATLNHNQRTLNDLNNFQNYISHHREKLSTNPRKQAIHKTKQKNITRISKATSTAFKRLFGKKKKIKLHAILMRIS